VGFEIVMGGVVVELLRNKDRNEDAANGFPRKGNRQSQSVVGKALSNKTAEIK
jgi:hypothetical protein